MITTLFIVCAGMWLGGSLLTLVGSSVYDIQAIRRQRRMAAHPYARQYRARPLVSVVITAHNNQTTIEACLQALLSSSYRKLEVIVIDNASTDQTRRLVRRFADQHAHRSLRLVARRSESVSPGVLKANVKRYARGEYILSLEATDSVHTRAIAAAVRQFNLMPGLDGLVLHSQLQASYSTLGLLQHYRELLRVRSRKLLSVLRIDMVYPTEPLLYRKPTFLQRCAARSSAVFYAYDSLVLNHTQPSIFKLAAEDYRFKLSRWIAAGRLFVDLLQRRGLAAWAVLASVPFLIGAVLASLALPIFISYFLYIGISLHEPALFLLSCSLIGGWTILAVWGDAHLRIAQKTVYTLLLPVTFVGFYMLALTHWAAAGRLLRPAFRRG